MTEKPLLIVSACLVDYPYRYDGKDERIREISELRDEFELYPICPEVAIGLGVPRPPIKFVPAEGEIRLLHSERGELYLESKLRTLAEELLKELEREGKVPCGALLKSRSPSCGIDGAKIYRDLSSDSIIGYKKGCFAERLEREGFPIITERDFLEPKKRELFLSKVRRFWKERSKQL